VDAKDGAVCAVLYLFLSLIVIFDRGFYSYSQA